MPSASPTYAPSAYVLPPTVSESYLASVLLNVSNSSAPPVSGNYSPPNFVLRADASRLHQANSYRSVQTVTLNGPNAEPYLVGLLIVPFIMAVAIIIWSVVLCIVDGQAPVASCTGRRRKRAPCRCCCKDPAPPKCCRDDACFVWFVITLIMSWIAWCVALGYNFALYTTQSDIEPRLQGVSDLMLNVSGSAKALSNAMLAFANLQATILANCSSAASAPATTHSAAQITSAANALLAGPVAQLPVVASQVSQFASSSEYVVTVRVTAFGVTLLVLVILMLVFIVGVMLQELLPPKRLKKATCCSRAEQCEICLSRVVFLILGIFLLLACWLCAAGSYFLALANSDMCTRDVNTNLVNVLAQSLRYEPIVSYPVDANPPPAQTICDEVFANNAPSALQALCFYQTCNASLKPVILDGINMTTYSLISGAQLLLLANQTILQFAVPSQVGECFGLVEDAYHLVVFGWLQLLWILYDTSCQRINPTYVWFSQELMCGSGISSALALMTCMLLGCCLMMLAVLIYVGGGLAAADRTERIDFRCCPRGPGGEDRNMVEHQSSATSRFEGAPLDCEQQQSKSEIVLT
jgi:hypothetical protein